MNKTTKIEADDATKSVSNTQRVYEDLRNRIVTGTIPPGSKLKVESLKATLDTGASPIREALSLLTSDQLVERLDQRGFRAAEVSADHFREILKLRCALEEIALRESISLAESDWEEELVLVHHRMVRTPKDDPVFETHHKAFHMALLSACASPILLRFCDQLYDLNIRYRYLAGSAKSYPKRDVSKEHEDIMAAAVDRDADAAVSKLLQHYTRTGQFLVEHFES
ncbi:MAG: GntR family transcriptional regulator [Pseudomonadota bacterium]